MALVLSAAFSFSQEYNRYSQSEDYRAGLESYNNENYADADIFFSHELNQHPDNGYAWFYLAFLDLIYKENPEQALEYFDRARIFIPEADCEYQTETLIGKSLAYMFLKDLENASDMCDRAVMKANESKDRDLITETYLNRADVYMFFAINGICKYSEIESFVIRDIVNAMDICQDIDVFKSWNMSLDQKFPDSEQVSKLRASIKRYADCRTERIWVEILNLLDALTNENIVLKKSEISDSSGIVYEGEIKVQNTVPYPRDIYVVEYEIPFVQKDGLIVLTASVNGMRKLECYYRDNVGLRIALVKAREILNSENYSYASWPNLKEGDKFVVRSFVINGREYGPIEAEVGGAWDPIIVIGNNVFDKHKKVKIDRKKSCLKIISKKH